MENTYCIYNGSLVDLSQIPNSISNRAFRYGDSLFESIHYTNKKAMFISDHIKRLKLSMTVLRMNVPIELTSENIEKMISQLVIQNSITCDARIRLTVYRNNGGLYTPETNDISFLIEATPLESIGYEINKKGIWVDLYAEIKKSINKISALKTGSALLYVMAGLTKTSLKLDDCLIINENGHIIESINSNIFVIKNGVLFTSPVSDGCVDGVMRKQIMDIAKENRILTFEQPLTVNTLMNGDEVFLTNAIQGIQWVGQFKSKFYTNQQCLFFNEQLNLLTK